jgi:hypothetical protein
MKLTNLVSSVLLAGVVAPPTLAQETISTVVFAAGENGGALPVAQGFYGKSQAMETAVVDIDNDGSAEIAVKFTEGCTTDGCLNSLLYYSNDQWLEIIQNRTQDLAISSVSTDGFRNIHTTDNAVWKWINRQYQPVPDQGDVIWDAGEASGVLSPAEAANKDIREFSDPEKYTLDVDGDGSDESFVISISPSDCGPMNACPVIVHSSDDVLLGKIYALEARVIIHDGNMHALAPTGFSSFAIRGQSLENTSRLGRAEIRGQ